MRKTTSLLLICALLGAGLAGPARGQEPVVTGQPAQLSFFGMNTYFTGLERISRDGDDGVATLIARGRELGVGWAREELSWGNLERHGKGRWEWSIFDRRLLATARAGYGIVGMLLTSPRWARVADCEARRLRYADQGVRADDFWCPPANVQDFADYVAAVVERYDADGLSDAPGSPRVAVWQIWNEPNAWETWPGSPAEYGLLLQAGYSAAKAADPSALVATAGLYVLDGGWNDGRGHMDGLRFLDEALAAVPTAWPAFDALAIHPYLPDVAPDQPGLYGAVTYWGRLSTASGWLAQRTATLGGPPRPLWISEVGWSTCGAEQADCYALSAGQATRAPRTLAESGYLSAQRLWRDSSVAGLIGKSEQEQADYMVRAHGMALALGVRHLSYFQLEDKFDGSAGNFWEEASLLRTKAEGYAAKPAAAAYATMVAQLGRASFVGYGPLHSYAYLPTEPNPAARYHLRFRDPADRVIDLLWQSAGGEAFSIALEPGHTASLIGRDGASTPLVAEAGVAQISLGPSPIYLVQYPNPSWLRTYLPTIR
jgi:hypothetical protein